MHRVRTSVRENRLTSIVLTETDYTDAIEVRGRGWVVDIDGVVVGFAVGNATNGNLWALFVDPRHEGQGYGRHLHDTVVEWLWTYGLDQLWLTTEPDTRAQRFYEAAGWQCVGRAENGELRFELHHPRNTQRPTL
jgi:GNAT superfamily N-acetyltransferase